MNCPYCANKLPERGVFCPNCGKQTRCKECRDILEIDAKVCVMCGANVLQSNTTLQDSNKSNSVNSSLAHNTIRFRETPEERSFDANLTDFAVSEFGQVMGQFVSVNTYQNKQRRQNPTVMPSSVIDQGFSMLPADIDQVEKEDSSEKEEIQIKETVKIEDDSALLRRIFRYEGDILRLDETRLKAKSKKDAVRRVTFLFLYAHDLEGRHEVERKLLNNVLREAALLDNNAMSWIPKAPELLVNGGMVSIRITGKEEARNFLREINDPNISNDWQFGTVRPSRARNISKVDENDKEVSITRSRRKPVASRKVLAWIKKGEIMVINRKIFMLN
ncbi:MAG TPA: zinc ribbon domain-containing protein [Roseiflexaceae bacterium]|nr:zinc ribbon domain-containing protein [Roseiflexaceae bacterium]